MFFWAVLWWGGICVSDAEVWDSNFDDVQYVVAGSELTGLAWAPDGSNRLFVTRKGGVIALVKNGVTLSTPFATVSPLYTGSECGLVGICVDPNFIINGYVYVFATVSSSEQQIIRYTAVGDVGTAKTILIGGLPTNGANHDGGAVGIGPDGKLYWAIGDLGSGEGVDGDLTVLAAKVGRANLDGSVPLDNPFADGPGGNNDYIWARGFRNPFTFTFQPDTGALWLNCVGTLYEQIFLVNAGDHAGWNNYENNQPAGYIIPKIKYRTNNSETRGLVAASGAIRLNNSVTFTTTSTHGFRQGENLTIEGVANPSFDGTVYVASVLSPTTFTADQTGPDATSGGGTATTLDQGGSVTGGCFFDSTAVPPAYRGNFFYGDYNSTLAMRATLSPQNEVRTVDFFFSNSGKCIDMAIGPDGALYHGSYDGRVFRLSYTNYTSQQLIVTPTVARMFEAGITTFTVCLAVPPVENVDVAFSFAEGDATIGVSEGATLTFGPANWSTPQVVRVLAGVDADATDARATFTLAAIGLDTQTVTVHALDLPYGPFSVGPVSREPGPEPQPMRVGLTGQIGQAYVLEAAPDVTAPWTPWITNILTSTTTNVLDPESVSQPQRLYRARLLP